MIRKSNTGFDLILIRRRLERSALLVSLENPLWGAFRKGPHHPTVQPSATILEAHALHLELTHTLAFAPPIRHDRSWKWGRICTNIIRFKVPRSEIGVIFC